LIGTGRFEEGKCPAMLSPLDYEGVILEKEMEIEQRALGVQLLDLTEDEDAQNSGSVRLSLARLIVGLGLKLDPAAAGLAIDRLET
jgi:hypothetical protein